MGTLVKLSGKAESVTFSDKSNLKDVAGYLSTSLHASRGPIETYGKYYRNNPYVNPYPEAKDTTLGDDFVDVTRTASGEWVFTTSKIVGKATDGTGVHTDTPKQYNGITTFLDSFKAPKFVFEVDKMYIIKYNRGSKPGSDRFIKVTEVNPNGILVEDLQINEVRNFLYSHIENPRKVG